MTFVPIMVPNNRKTSYRSRSGNILAIVVLALVFFGLMFFFMFRIFGLNRFSFSILPMISGGIIFIILMIICISAISISMTETYKKPKEQNLKSYNSNFQSLSQHHNQKQISNPYIIHKSVYNQNEFEEQIIKGVKPDILLRKSINFCRFCGAKIDRDAVFCHQCGIKLSS
ncbi:MAG: zinc ribbon domain-containing protein [Candidatus Odinarchaeota archaeon]